MRSHFTVFITATVACLLLLGCGGGGDSRPPSVTESQPLEEPIVSDVIVGSGLRGEQLVGQPFQAKLSVAAVDKRNQVVGYRIANPQLTGSMPTIDGQGLLSWTPNEIDFISTRELMLTVQLRSGNDQIVPIPVTVRKERLVFQVAVPSSTGTVADPAGRYLIKLSPRTAGAAMTGTVSLVEVYEASGFFRFSVRLTTGSNAKVEVLDSPVSSTTTSGAPVSRQGAASTGNKATPGTAGKPSMEGEAAAESLQKDVGLEFGGPGLSGVLGSVANVGPINVYTTRGEQFLYQTSSAPEQWEPSERSRVFQIDANCTSVTTCRALRSIGLSPTQRSPVILVHGFWVGESVGGGDGTWGSLAKVLTDRGHPVFELRWVTYMRFEEAAGVLAALSKRVAEVTGNKPMVIAHSFGGIVAHTAAMGRGIRFDGTAWSAVSVDGVFARLLTLGSPLSGIRYVPAAAPLNLTGGRDDDDVSISVCRAITCFQAGAELWSTVDVTWLIEKLAAIDPTRVGLPDSSEGATIRNLHEAWSSGRGHNVPFTTVVSLKKRPYDDYAPDLTNTTAHDLGDGLISLVGQAVLPQDFAQSPLSARSSLDIFGRLSTTFIDQLDAANAASLVYRAVDGRQYYFALRAKHTSYGPLGSTMYYPIARYPANGKLVQTPISGTGQEVDHPLSFFIATGTSFLAATPTAYTGAIETPPSVVRGRTVMNGSFSGPVPLRFQLESASTGLAVSDLHSISSRATDGTFVIDAGRILADLRPGQLSNIADYRIVISGGDGLRTARVRVRQPLSANVNLGDLDLTLSAVALVNANGSVIDGQTLATAVGGAEISLMKGLNQREDLVRLAANTTTSRRLTADSSGRFSLTGLEPGTYTVVVGKAGYSTQTQGSVLLSTAGGNTLSFSLLRELAASEAAITLRWADASSGAGVSPDLDSHLTKYRADGSQAYHIYYGNRNGSATDSLDRDDTSYVGPETITLAVDSTARYRYYVHNFRAGGASTIGGSSATVILRFGTQMREFTLPRGESNTAAYWHVFDLRNGVVEPCASNCLVNTPPI